MKTNFNIMVTVFRTSVITEQDVIKPKPEIDNLTTKISWNFDLKDCDNILRIDSNEVTPDQVISLLKMHYYDCNELN